MKPILKKASLLITGVMAAGSLFAQTDSTSNSNYVQPFSNNGLRTWSVGVHGGLLTPYSIFHNLNNSDFRSPHEQIGYGAYIKKQILPSFALQADFLRGRLEGAVGQPGDGTGPQKFRTDLNWSAALSTHFTLANINWSNKKGVIQPYLSLGGGIIAYKPTVTAANGTVTTFGDGDIHEFFIPVGAGVKVNLGSGVNLDLGYQVNFVNADNLDAFNYGNSSDRFSYAHIGLEFALGSSKKPQMATYNPVNSMRTEYQWEAKNLQSQVDAQKAENARLRSDLDATNANIAKMTTDSDGDGVVDMNDKCPNTPSGTKVDGSGCPLAKPEVKVYVTEEDKRIVKDAIKNLEFDLGKATIRSTSFPSLDRVANLLMEKNFSLKLAGHTDNTGSDELNLRLSKNRAEAIKSYLVDKGANASRIEATGYGESQPISTNKTAAGRQQNRRVEFTLY